MNEKGPGFNPEINEEEAKKIEGEKIENAEEGLKEFWNEFEKVDKRDFENFQWQIEAAGSFPGFKNTKLLKKFLDNLCNLDNFKDVSSYWKNQSMDFLMEMGKIIGREHKETGCSYPIREEIAIRRIKFVFEELDLIMKSSFRNKEFIDTIENRRKFKLDRLKGMLEVFKEHIKYTREEKEKEKENKKRREEDREKYEEEKAIREKETLENKNKIEKDVKQKSLKIKLLEKF